MLVLYLRKNFKHINYLAYFYKLQIDVSWLLHYYSQPFVKGSILPYIIWNEVFLYSPTLERRVFPKGSWLNVYLNSELPASSLCILWNDDRSMRKVSSLGEQYNGTFLDSFHFYNQLEGSWLDFSVISFITGLNSELH